MAVLAATANPLMKALPQLAGIPALTMAQAAPSPRLPRAHPFLVPDRSALAVFLGQALLVPVAGREHVLPELPNPSGAPVPSLLVERLSILFLHIRNLVLARVVVPPLIPR